MSPNFLKHKLARMFLDSIDREIVANILQTYGTEDHEREPVRVRLAVLKLGGTDVEGIKILTKSAKDDFRDVLSWAEYPRQSRNWSMPDGLKKRAMIEADTQEYQQWLNT